MVNRSAALHRHDLCIGRSVGRGDRVLGWRHGLGARASRSKQRGSGEAPDAGWRGLDRESLHLFPLRPSHCTPGQSGRGSKHRCTVFIPLAEGEEADYEQIAADFITEIVPERLGWEDVKSLIGSRAPRFPALVVVRGGRVAARFEYPLSLKVLSSLPTMFGIDHGALTAITVAATPPPIASENLP